MQVTFTTPKISWSSEGVPEHAVTEADLVGINIRISFTLVEYQELIYLDGKIDVPVFQDLIRESLEWGLEMTELVKADEAKFKEAIAALNEDADLTVHKNLGASTSTTPLVFGVEVSRDEFRQIYNTDSTPYMGVLAQLIRTCALVNAEFRTHSGGLNL